MDVTYVVDDNVSTFTEIAFKLLICMCARACTHMAYTYTVPF